MIGPNKGWLARQQNAQAKIAAGISTQLSENMRNADQRDRQDRADAEAFALAQEKLRQSTLCGCPACAASGEVTEAEAAFIAHALAYFRSKSLIVDPIYFDKSRMLPRPVRGDATEADQKPKRR